jgi:transposase-like protein
MLREAEIKLAGGKTTGEVCRELGISEQSYYRWRKEYGGMQVSQAKKLKDLERENARLKKLVAEQSLDKAILEEALKGMYGPPRDCNNPRLGVARQVCINVSGLLVGDSGPGHDGDPRAVGSISWFGL